MAFDWSDLPHKQKAALLYLLENPAATHKEIAEHLGVHPSTVSKWKLDALAQEALADRIAPALEGVQAALVKAVAKLTEQIDHEDPKVAQGAAVKLLEWGLGKPTVRSHSTGEITGEIEVVRTRMDVERLL